MEKKPRKKTDANAWLNTYADMVTLLLCFFVLLYSASEIDATRWKQIADNLRNPAFQPTQPGDPGEEEGMDTAQAEDPLIDFRALLNKISEEFEGENTVDIQISESGDFVFVTFRDSIFFEPNKAELLPSGNRALRKFIRAISGSEDVIGALKVYGHTTQLREANEYLNIRFDIGLSTERAATVLSRIMIDCDIVGKNVSADGKGMYWPVADFRTEEGRRMNRRVEILVANDLTKGITLEEVYEVLGIELHE